MFNYSKANLESLNNDLDSTLEECKKLVENIKSSTNVNLNDFNDLESTVYDVSGRVAFLGDVHPKRLEILEMKQILKYKILHLNYLMMMIFTKNIMKLIFQMQIKRVLSFTKI